MNNKKCVFEGDIEKTYLIIIALQIKKAKNK
jgi:hypothetical protein